MSHGRGIVGTTISGPSVQAASSSSLSDDEILYGTLQAEPNHQQRRHKRQSKTWNCPRKTIKAVDSMGRIEEKLNLIEGLRSTGNNNPRNKCQKKIKGRIERYKRLLELAKPKSVVSNEIDDSIRCFKKGKFCMIKHRGTPKPYLVPGKKILDPEQDLIRSKTVMPKKMVYKTSEHTRKLAEPRVRHEVGIRLPGKVIESALFASASKRLVKLATPKSNMRSTVLRESKTATIRTAYGVSRKALQAVCSPRILTLSAPKNPEKLLNDKKSIKLKQRPC